MAASSDRSRDAEEGETMTNAELLSDGFTRVQHVVRASLEGIDEEGLTYRVDPDTNSIAWLVWHIGRVQDAQIAPLAGTGQVWLEKGFADKFALPFDDHATGYGHSSEEVGAVHASAGLLRDYVDAAHAGTLAFLAGVSDRDTDRVIDTSWTPPVTLGVRLVSILADTLQHAGQAAFVRGIVGRRG
jgi:hypothetical protein